MSHPVATANCVAWYRGDSLTDGGGGVASDWQDKTANNLDLTANNSPTIDTAGYNGRAAANLAKASSQSFNRATTPSQAQPLTIMCVSLVNDLTGSEFDVMADNNVASTGCSMFYFDDSGTDRVGFFAGSSPGTHVAALAAGVWRLHVGIFNGASSELYVNNSLVANGNIGATGLTGFRVGNGVFASQHWDGKIAEVVVWNKALSSTERAELLAYYLEYYAATASADGVATVAAVSSAQKDAVGASSGVAAVAAVSAAQADSPFSSAGVAALSFVGGATIAAAFNVGAIATVQGVTLNAQDGAFSAAGAATVSFVGSIASAGIFSVEGAAVVSFTGNTVKNAVFAAAGLTSVSFLAPSVDAVFAIAGQGEVQFVGSPLGWDNWIPEAAIDNTWTPEGSP